MLACAARRGREILPRVPHSGAGTVAVPFYSCSWLLWGVTLIEGDTWGVESQEPHWR